MSFTGNKKGFSRKPFFIARTLDMIIRLLSAWFFIRIFQLRALGRGCGKT